MAQYVIATTKSWNVDNFKKLVEKFPSEQFFLITEKEKLTVENLQGMRPEYVFFPHWSWMIPKEIYDAFQCVVFHMTDLPFGRGGSPLQNLIVRGIYETKISAIRVEKGVDTGGVYMKQTLDISTGNVNEILSRVSDVVFAKMIPEFICKTPVAVKQEGEVVTFKRRTPEESEIPEGLSQRQIYDYIRMLDGEGYPAAYKDVNGIRLTFKDAEYDGKKVYAKVEIAERLE